MILAILTAVALLGYMTALVVALTKGRRSFFALGILIFPFAFAGALLPAKPDSPWTRGGNDALKTFTPPVVLAGAVAALLALVLGLLLDSSGLEVNAGLGRVILVVLVALTVAGVVAAFLIAVLKRRWPLLVVGAVLAPKPDSRWAQGKGGAIRKLAPGAAVAGAVAAVLLLSILVVGVAFPFNEEDDVRETLDDFAAATRAKDYQRLCDELYASDLVQRISSVVPCEVALKTGLESRQNPTLTVLAVSVSGDEAGARVRSTAGGEVPSVDQIRLIREDEGWRVASLGGSPSEGRAPAP